jgi:geranylgeranyl pyrophosphate synthase
LITLPTLYYLESNPDDERMQIVLENSHSNEEVVQSLVASIRESGAIHYAMQDAEDFVERGLEMLSGFPDNQERKALEELALYIVSRQL